MVDHGVDPMSAGQGAGEALSAAAIAALRGLAELNGAYDVAPTQAVHPFATVDVGLESDWSHKSGEGREVRLAVTIRDQGERPARLRRLIRSAESTMGGAGAVQGWRIVTLHFLRSRVVRESAGWAGIVEFRARMLAEQ